MERKHVIVLLVVIALNASFLGINDLDIGYTVEATESDIATVTVLDLDQNTIEVDFTIFVQTHFNQNIQSTKA